jgi:alkanesulfonate monooxygenase SsuD/methylene tetrahydromethanopterin reductase-like flavin-dependent oxidoreductase (luciferase family)
MLHESWEASWENNVRLAQLAEEVGIECMIPIARCKGYEGQSNPKVSSFESIAWACGLLAATRRINVFCTVHVPLHHPVAAAKQMATADHIGQGRLGVNIVCGWNEDEFQMFGLSPHEHEARYAQGDEWWGIVKRIWAGEEPFDFDGTYYRLRGVQSLPRPYGAGAPLMMNAGSSPAGRQFAIRHSDMHFDGVDTPEASRDRIAETKRLARKGGRDIQVWTPVGIVCRPTQKDADDYVQYVVDHADWERSAIGSSGKRTMHARGPMPRACEGVAGTPIFRLSGGSWGEGAAAWSVIRTPWHGRSLGCKRRGWTAWPSTSSTICKRYPISLPKSCRDWSGLGCAQPPLANQRRRCREDHIDGTGKNHRTRQSAAGAR